MPRINLIHPRYLTHRHLQSEVRELPRAFRLIVNAKNANKGLNDYSIPLNYKLGKGHIVFFFNKANYLIHRWNLLRQEMHRRGFSISDDHVAKTEEYIRLLPHWSLTEPYTPKPAEVYLNMHRLVQRHYKQTKIEE